MRAGRMAPSAGHHGPEDLLPAGQPKKMPEARFVMGVALRNPGGQGVGDGGDRIKVPVLEVHRQVLGPTPHSEEDYLRSIAVSSGGQHLTLAIECSGGIWEY